MPARILLALFLACSLTAAQDIFSLHEKGETPSRTYDVLHYKIDVRIDEQARSVEGTVTITLVPLMPHLATITLNAAEMNIAGVTLANRGKNLAFHAEPYTLTIDCDRLYTPKDTIRVAVDYSCKPKKGMTFYTPDSGYPAKRAQFWSQGEDTTNHFWFPCYDFPNDKATSEVIATVNGKFTVLSNGKLLKVQENKRQGTKTFHWYEARPHSSYLIMVAGGEYAVLHDHAGKLPLDYYVYPDDTLNARICFRETPAMIQFFNDKIGFNYPWEKYGQILLQDHFGGMENSSATTLSDDATVYDARVRVDNTPTGLIAHELAHQWWGDVVTCKDFRHIWLNESFASYFDPLYHEFSLGRDEFAYMMYNNQQAGIIVDTSRGRKPIVSEESYGENVYPRGASVLHMLRFLLGDDLFWKSINRYITMHQFQPVETNDLKRAIEETAGQNLYWFFDEWVYKAGHPVFDLSYAWSDSLRGITLSVKQVQAIDSLTGVFRMPVDVEITTSEGATTQRVNLISKDTTLFLPVGERPRLVIFDKGNWLIKELRWEKSLEEWKYQAAMASNPVDRIRALQALAKSRPGDELVPVFVKAMTADPFWAVRREAVNQSGKLDTKDGAMKMQLRDAYVERVAEDKKSAVRDAAAQQLAKFPGESMAIAALRRAMEDSSYSVISSALRSYAKADSAHALAVVSEYIHYPSYRNRIHNAALNALSLLDSTRALAIAMGDVRYGQPVTSRFTALGILNKFGKGNNDVMALCESLLSDKSEGIRSMAARMLGELGGEAEVGALEKIASDKGNAASDAAKASIEKIRKRSEKKAHDGH
jgi:aminopeptidase N